MGVELQLSYIASDGETWSGTPWNAAISQLLNAKPIRAFPTHARLRHYPGTWWSSTNRDFVGYESLLERDYVMQADFASNVQRIVSQPFVLTGVSGSNPVRRIPDYLVVDSSRRATVVDVKPARMLAHPDVVASLSWTGRALAEVGWKYHVWSGLDPILSRNLRLISRGRAANSDESSDLDSAILKCVTVDDHLGSLVANSADALGIASAMVRGSVLRLLWCHRLATDLSSPLSADSPVRV